MKMKVLRLLINFLLLFLIFNALLVAGCEKDKWVELQLTDNYCEDVLNEGTNKIKNHTGIIIPSNMTTPAFAIDADEYGNILQGRRVLLPCNLLHNNLLFEGQKIVFSGELISWKSSDTDSIVKDYFSIPIVLTNAKVINH